MASHFPSTHAYTTGIFIGENKSSSEAQVIWPKPCIKNNPFGVDVGKMNIQIKLSGDLHGLASFRPKIEEAERYVFPLDFKYPSYNMC